MNLLYALESVRTPFWDAVFSAVTHLGEETRFHGGGHSDLLVRQQAGGVLSLLMGFFRHGGQPVSEAAVPIPRRRGNHPTSPLWKAPGQATGYSFPSGHTQNAVATFGGIAPSTAAPDQVAACVAVLLLVSFSPAVPGVHTPLDVGVSFAVAR